MTDRAHEVLHLAIDKKPKGILKPTVQITVLSVLGIAVSFINQIIVASLFGATAQRDAYFSAMAVVAYISSIFVGSLPVTFMPVFIEHQTRDPEQAWKAASSLLNVTFVFLLIMTLLGLLFSQQMIAITAPGFKGEKLLLTVALFKIILPSIIFSSLTGLLSSLYYAEHKFLLPAISPVISGILTIASVVLFSQWIGIKSLAVGFLVGSLTGCILLMPGLVKGKRYTLSFEVRHKAIRQAIKVALPLVLAGSIFRLTTVFERLIASTLPTGSISYLGYANQIMQILVSIVSSGIATTIFPMMSRAWSENDLTQVREYFGKGVRIILLITLPIVALFIVLGEPIIQFVFERGAFDHQATLAVSRVLAILMGAFIANSLGNVVAKGFYISQRTVFVSIQEILVMIVYMVLAYVLASFFSFIGLAIAIALSGMLSVTISTVVMRRIFKGINGKKLAGSLAGILISAGISAVCMKMVFSYFSPAWALVLSLGWATLVGLVSYFGLVAFVFRIEEAVATHRTALNFIGRLVPSGASSESN